MKPNIIDNQLVPSDGADEIEVIDPATEEPIDTIPRGCPADIDMAVAAAHGAQPSWGALSPTQRRDMLRGLASEIESHRNHIARILTLEHGKPLPQAQGEVGMCIEMIHSLGEQVVHLRTGAQTGGKGDLIFQHRQPRGVAGCIVPWNFPLALGLESVVTNLSVGNTVVWKPSEKTPLSSVYIAEHCLGHLPPGVVNLVLGDGLNAGAHLVEHPDVDLIVFVGSERTGRMIGEICGRNLKKVVLELGGKDPLIVDETVDVKAAARLAADSTYANAGQICTSTERIYVHRSIFDQFRDALVVISHDLKVGSGLDEGVQMGPIVDSQQLERVASQVDDAVGRGAEVHTGGFRPDRKGYFYPPTVLTAIDKDMVLMQEETFGPIAPLIPFDDFDEALQYANDSRYGLAAIVCTTSAPRAIKALEELDVGMVKINVIRGRAPGATSEPCKASGLGHGYGPEHLYELTRQKSVHWRGTL